MSQHHAIEPSQVLDVMGEMIAALSVFSAKVPAQSFMSIPGGIRPTLEAVESYEETVYRFRDYAGHTFKVLTPMFIESLEAFEAGRVFDAVPPLVQALDLLVDLHKQEKVAFTPAEKTRIRDLHQRIGKIMPETNQPEVDMPPPTSY